ncbi:hypothetical protein FA13DRAFT_1704963 [Coprinellus micaceus]|uniref:Uncharacterized protein n=1 Tax=Coprinellus micaceus TaxID=71717 RepID=A0A4Y7TUK0_COPMI|nr:hypothetical protein FA13DRAFT_1704963 [Coprinellus micaceus]
MSVFPNDLRSTSPYSLVSPLPWYPQSPNPSTSMAFESAISSPAYTALDTKPLLPPSPEGTRSPPLPSAATPTFVNAPTGAIVLPSDDKKDGNDPFADPFRHEDDIDKASITVAHSHHFATHLTGNITTPAATHPAPAYDPTIEEIHFAAERLALALEAAASREPEGRVKRALLKRARKVREQIGSLDTDPKSCEGRAKVVKMVGVGLLLVCTTPLYVYGAVIEGTGVVLQASGMALKGTGKGLKKLHIMTAEKLDLKF